LTEYSLASFIVNDPTKLQNFGTNRLTLEEIFDRLISGKVIVIPRFEQSLGGDVYVKLSDNKYPHTLIGMYADAKGPTAWQSYSINLDALSTFPCYEFTEPQKLMGGIIKTLAPGTIIRYLLGREPKEEKKTTSTIENVFFLPRQGEPEETTEAPSEGNPNGNEDNEGDVVGNTGNPIKDSLWGVNTVRLPDGRQMRLNRDFNNSMGTIININDSYGYGNASTIPESSYVDYSLAKDNEEEGSTGDEAPGIILYTLDNQEGYFAIMATPEAIVKDPGDTITLEG